MMRRSQTCDRSRPSRVVEAVATSGSSEPGHFASPQRCRRKPRYGDRWHARRSDSAVGAAPADTAGGRRRTHMTRACGPEFLSAPALLSRPDQHSVPRHFTPELFPRERHENGPMLCTPSRTRRDNRPRQTLRGGLVSAQAHESSAFGHGTRCPDTRGRAHCRGGTSHGLDAWGDVRIRLARATSARPWHTVCNLRLHRPQRLPAAHSKPHRHWSLASPRTSSWPRPVCVLADDNRSGSGPGTGAGSF
jgi:hypothetical protein